MGQIAPAGEIFTKPDLLFLLEEGHELGCHTYAHLAASATLPSCFEESIVENGRALQHIAPGAKFETLSYPIGNPTPEIKRRAGRHFLGCRGGGQKHNRGTLDLDLLSAFFLEQCGEDLGVICQAIEATCRDKGWLIFATHDVSDDPSSFGCRPAFFNEVIRCAQDSNATVLPVARALQVIHG